MIIFKFLITMNKGRILMFALVALLASACVTDPVMDEGVVAEKSVAKKIINTSENAAPGELILYVDEETADVWSQAASVTRSDSGAIDALNVDCGATSLHPVFNMNINGEQKRAMNMHRWFVVRFDKEADVDVVAQKFAAMSEVERVEFATVLMRPQMSARPAQERMATRADGDVPFNDPMLELQWHYHNQGLQSIYKTSKEGEDINAFAAWKYTTGSNQIVVAVMDEGVKYNHPDLEANMWKNQAELNGQPGVDDDGNGVVDDIYGVNCVDLSASGKLSGNISWDQGSIKTDSKGNKYWDGDSGHGTHVAGTVAAVNNNGLGVAGVAGGSGNGDGVRIMSIQIFDGEDNSTFATNARGVEYAADNGACILQCSWGYPLREGQTITDGDYESGYGVELAGMRYFVSQSGSSAMRGNVVIFAAGNDAKASADYPGAFNEFIAVTAYAPDGLPTTYTNYNYGCNVAAPGGDIWISGQYSFDYAYEGSVLSTIPAETVDPYTLQKYGTDYGYMQGTSMACPHVSGIAALVLSYAVENGITLTNTQLYDIITSSVRNIDNRLTGTKVYGDNSSYSMGLDSYKGKMGTGKIDALMAIQSVRGTICVPAIVGEEIELDPAKLVGDGSISITGYNSFDIDDNTKSRLGIDKVDLFGGKVYFTPKNAGIGMVTLKYIAGGKTVGGGNTTGGKLMEKEVVVVVRDTNDNGGWM